MQLGDAAEVTRKFLPSDINDYSELVGHTPASGEVPEPLIGALFSYLLGVKLPGMGTMYLKQDSEFKAVALVEETLIARVEVIKLRPQKHLVDLRTVCRTTDGKLVCEGRALVYVKDVR